MWDSLLSSLQAQLSNQIVSGGIALGLAGLVVTQLNKFIPWVWTGIKRLLVVTAVVDNRNDVFKAVIKWLHSQPYSRSASFFTVTQEHAGGAQAGRVPELLYSPAVGWHLLRYQGKLVWIERSLDADKMQPLETLRISMLFARRSHFEKLIADMMQASFGQLMGQTQLFAPDSWADEWRQHASKPKRKLDSVVLQEGLTDKLVADVQRFLSGRARYEALGIPWRRGYLLHGPPGTGKTSLVFALAGELGLDICTLSLLNRKLNDQNIAGLLQNSPPQSILLLEDVDSFFQERAKQDAKIEVSFSGLLNALDGVAAQEGRVVFMTTNHVSTLDPALIRPGRIDLSLKLDKCLRPELRRMVVRFFPALAEQPELDAALLHYSDRSMSPAEVQQALQECYTPEAALSALSELCPVPIGT
jgi:mitochondrial chaperone BCS1